MQEGAELGGRGGWEPFFDPREVKQGKKNTVSKVGRRLLRYTIGFL